MCYANTSQKKPGVAVLISDEIQFRKEEVTRDKGGLFIIRKGQ